MKTLIKMYFNDEDDKEEFIAILTECGVDVDVDEEGVIVDVDDVERVYEIADDNFITYEVE